MYNKVYENGILGEEQLSLHPQADNADIVQDKLYLQHAFTTDLNRLVSKINLEFIGVHYENTPILLYRKFHLQKLKFFG